jgi:hypothetical protein
VVTSTIVGKIQTVSQRRVSILDSEGLRHDFTLSQKTQLVRDGRSMPLEQLREGTEVRATYDLANDPNHATRIEVIGKKAKAARR